MYKGVKYEGKHSAILIKEEYANFKCVRDQKYVPKPKKHKFIYRGIDSVHLERQIYNRRRTKGRK